LYLKFKIIKTKRILKKKEKRSMGKMKNENYFVKRPYFSEVV